MVTINKCYLVKQWQTFRAAFTMLYELRAILPADVVWFGYSATLNVNTERVILNKAGFRSVRPHMYETQVIRTLINRDDIAFCV